MMDLFDESGATNLVVIEVVGHDGFSVQDAFPGNFKHHVFAKLLASTD